MQTMDNPSPPPSNSPFRAAGANLDELSLRIASLLKYFELDPSNTRLAREILDQAYLDQQWQFIGDFFSTHSALLTHSAEMMAIAGHAQLNLGNASAAQPLLNQALDLGVDDDNVVYNAAYANFLAGDLDQSLKIIETITPIYVHYPLVAVLHARVLYFLGRVSEAINLLNQFTVESAELQGLKSLLIQDSDNGSVDEVFLYANRCLTQDPNNQDALLALASLHLERLELDQALPHLNHLLELSPNHGRALSGAGQVAFHAFEFERALPLFDKAVQTMGNHIGTWHLKAWTEILTNKLDDALISMLKAYDLDHNFAETHGGLASIYALQGELALAERHVKIANRIDSSGLASVFAQMVLLNKSGKNLESQELFNRVTQTKNKRLNIFPSDLINQRLTELSTTKTRH